MLNLIIVAVIVIIIFYFIKRFNRFIVKYRKIRAGKKWDKIVRELRNRP